MNIPLRGRGKKSAANVEHVVQDLDVRFKIGDKVSEGSLLATIENGQAASSEK